MDRRAASHKYYLRIRDARKRERQETRQILTLLKMLHGCQRCGYRGSAAALEFHHRDPATKSFKVSNGAYSLRRLLEEARKCDVLCGRCHNEAHQ